MLAHARLIFFNKVARARAGGPIRWLHYLAIQLDPGPSYQKCLVTTRLRVRSVSARNRLSPPMLEHVHSRGIGANFSHLIERHAPVSSDLLRQDQPCAGAHSLGNARARGTGRRRERATRPQRNQQSLESSRGTPHLPIGDVTMSPAIHCHTNTPSQRGHTNTATLNARV